MKTGSQVLPEFGVVRQQKDLHLFYVLVDFFKWGKVASNHDERKLYWVFEAIMFLRKDFGVVVEEISSPHSTPACRRSIIIGGLDNLVLLFYALNKRTLTSIVVNRALVTMVWTEFKNSSKHIPVL